QRQLTGSLLARQPEWKTIFASHGREALSKLAAQHIDVVLTDILMPEMNGLELLRAARRDFPHIPVILMTASGSEDMAGQALQEGQAPNCPNRGMARRLNEPIRSVLDASTAERTHSDLCQRLISQDLSFVLENDPTLVLALPAYLRPYLNASGLTDHLTRL